MANAHEIRDLLAGTSVPPMRVDALLAAAPATWLASAPPAVLAADLALVHPPLRDDEVRAVARPLAAGGTRLIVVARDRVGLLADTAAAVAAAGGTVRTASAATWLGEELALHALTLDGPVAWRDLEAHLRAVGRGGRPAFRFEAAGRARVELTELAEGAAVVIVDAPDAPGLLAAACAALAEAGVTITAVAVDTVDGRAHDVFLTSGVPDAVALATRLDPMATAGPSLADAVSLLLLPARIAGHVARAAWRTAVPGV